MQGRDHTGTDKPEPRKEKHATPSDGNAFLPSGLQTAEQREIDFLNRLSRTNDDMAKRRVLMGLRAADPTSFYYLTTRHLTELMPIIYTPTIAEAVRNFSDDFLPDGTVFLSIDNPDCMRDCLLAASRGRDIRLIIVTDGEGVLGIGDWGANGAAIVTGKALVYTMAAGMDPDLMLSVALDTGTDNETLLHDPHYLGNRHPRIRGMRYDTFIDRFVHTVMGLFPNALLHWEDFGRANAQRLLDQYRNTLPTFNDDVQGTGIVALAALLSAMTVSKQDLPGQRIMIFGAGTAGIGIARQICDEMTRQGVDPRNAIKQIYAVDQHGLIFEDDEHLTPGQLTYARPVAERSGHNLVDFSEAVELVRPTILIGTSGQHGAFSERIIRTMSRSTERPIIMPLSNPTELAEATPDDLLDWTDGRALIATGSPYDTIIRDGHSYEIGQSNNALMYPGLALGAIAADASRITDGMLSCAAHALTGILDSENGSTAILPPISRIRDCSHAIAHAVAEYVAAHGLSRHPSSDIDAAIAGLIKKY